MNHQDWKPVVWVKEAPKNTKNLTSHEIEKCKRQGQFVTKSSSSSGPKTTTTTSSSNLRKLDMHGIVDDDDDKDQRSQLKLKRVSVKFSQALMKARQAKGFTQKELATRINQTQSVIAQYENGSAIRNGNIVNLLNRVLGVTLPKD